MSRALTHEKELGHQSGFMQMLSSSSTRWVIDASSGPHMQPNLKAAQAMLCLSAALLLECACVRIILWKWKAHLQLENHHTPKVIDNCHDMSTHPACVCV